MGGKTKPRRQAVSQERLKELFSHNEQLGCFVRLTSHSGYSAGSLAFGTVTRCGHRRIVVDGVGYFAHNLFWFYKTGRWPEPMVDHEDGDGLNNTWGNLREATQSQNNANMRKREGTSSRFKGVSYDASRKRWSASLKWQGRTIFIGRFAREEDAGAAYMVKAREVFGEFARAA